MTGGSVGALRWATRVGAAALGVLACVAMTLALSVTQAAAAGCANEQLRNESAPNPANGHPYSTELPECRAYEMVSPLEKQSYGAGIPTGAGTPASANGETVGYSSEGDFADPENYKVNLFKGSNFYLAHRTSSGWFSASAFAPRILVDNPSETGLDTDLSPDLRSKQLGCGSSSSLSGEGAHSDATLVCATRNAEGSCFAPLPIPVSCWSDTLLYTISNTAIGGETYAYLGGSEDLTHVLYAPPGILSVTEGTPPEPLTGHAIYEIEGVGTASPQVRLVNVDSKGKELRGNNVGPQEPPRIGDVAATENSGGSSYHAMSANGEKVFIAALANENEGANMNGPSPEHPFFQTLYARVKHKETIPISAPECTEVEITGGTKVSCDKPGEESRGAWFQGASLDGSKVFFTTDQPLVETAKDETEELYEYDFELPVGERLIQISKGEANKEHPVAGEGADVGGEPSAVVSQGGGVVATSSDGSHVYYVALGVLTEKPNGNGEKAVANEPNLFGYDTITKETKFVATLSFPADEEVSGRNDGNARDAQATPDGNDLVFSSFSQLAGDSNSGGQAVYRYDFATGELTWVSHSAPGTAQPNEKLDSIVNPLPRARGGAMADINDYARAISGEGEQQGEVEGEHDGEYIIFQSTEKLQSGAPSEVGSASSGALFVWHNGTVHWVAANASVTSAISASGSDIFFPTEAQLVRQDKDTLLDFYDARIDGGFPAPLEPVCAPESEGGCQGKSTPQPQGGSASRPTFPAAGNLNPALGGVAAVHVVVKPKPLTRAQKLAKALKACTSKPKRKRAACKAQARKKYGPKAKPKPKAKKSTRRGK